MDVKTTTQSPDGDTRPTGRLPKEEAARLGREIYEREIRHQVESDHVGKIVAIDLDSGIWAMGDEILTATKRLRDKRPQAVNVFCERVGYWAAASMGGGMRRRTD